MRKAVVIFGPPNSGKTTYAVELCKADKAYGIVSEDLIALKIMNVMGQNDYWSTAGASQVKATYCKQINYNYLREQLLVLAILNLHYPLFKKSGSTDTLVFEGMAYQSWQIAKFSTTY